MLQAPENTVDIAIAITLSEREFSNAQFTLPVNPANLETAAFRRKEFHLRLEKGNFKVEGRTTFGANPTYAYRLLWDESPYPPLEEWKLQGAAKANRFWELKDFYKGMLED
jgi:hypothetical protein